ncbi:PilZN3 domain-containing protein [Borreliella garinii]|uniref:PilZN3 domain-containing protein n=1 Tax=Borreliella garinii TaxID=29519 RepID=UPI001AEEF81B|nr:hypothetical protein [Borreliella garinii]
MFGTIYFISTNSIKIIFRENEVLLALAKNKNLYAIKFKKNSNSKNNETYLPMKLLGISLYYYNNNTEKYNLLILEV